MAGSIISIGTHLFLKANKVVFSGDIPVGQETKTGLPFPITEYIICYGGGCIASNKYFNIFAFLVNSLFWALIIFLTLLIIRKTRNGLEK